ncbi:S53 family peptidase [Lentilactobacillus buchneri]|uniref:S53 family peptidase n=1 Tax=Lentilactobacillus buchneri TaxID=1581 RepID=UPI0012911A30|nr:protease pro-enzyme activation domain-containing protein [Lentilactobacillus buchneri]MQM77066.1 peptidase S53 [Lentilactobacillus buchneri]MQM87122.1 peptidase S53 [Lentilactobacillus buchneri]MQN21597.1 peptidase S53 [Lentilactobacillus buchneri]
MHTILKKRVIHLRGKQIVITALSSLLVLGTGLAISADQAKAAEKKSVVNVTFKPSDENELTDYVYNTVDPTSSQYHQYLTPSAFADKFGQSDSYIQAFQDYLAKYHVQAQAFPGNLSMKLTGTSTNLQKAFKAKYVPAKKKGYHPTTSYKLPGQLSDKVVAVIGLYSTNPNKKTKKTTKTATKAKKTTKKSATHSDTTTLSTTDTKPNIKYTGNAFSKKYGAAKFAKAYQVDDLYDQGLEGSGQRIGIINDSDVRDADMLTYWKQAGVNDDISRVHHIYTVATQAQAQADLNKSISAAQMEATLDAQSASAIAPEAQIDLYTAVQYGTKTTLTSAFYNNFMTAVSDNNDKQITTSMAPAFETKSNWPDPSASLSQYSHAFNLLLEQAAVQGITVFKASGDRGPYALSGAKENHIMSTSPYEVEVGGTTLPYQKIIDGNLISVNKERAWGDTYSRPAYDTKYSSFAGGGGGFLDINPTPRYQIGVPGVNTFRAMNYLTFKNGKYSITKNPHVITGTKTGRNLPDVAGNADPLTGYASIVSGPKYTFNPETKKATKANGILWRIDGGTSFTAPQMAAANAVMNSGRQTPIGFWNPQIYKYAQESDSPFNVLDDADFNDNLYYTGQPGKLYNQATGLGTINFNKLYNKFNNANN